MSYQRPKFQSGNKSFIAALNAVLRFAEKHGINPGGRPGWVETENGWMPPYVKATSEFGGSIWTLNVIDAGENQVALNLGTVIKDVSDLTDHAVIVDGSENFNVVATDMIWLKVEYSAEEEDLIITLESGDTWTGYPKAFELTGSGSTAEWVATRYVLYKFLAEPTAETIPISEGLHALKCIGDNHLAAIVTNFKTKGNDDKPVTGFTLIPYHRAIPL